MGRIHVEIGGIIFTNKQLDNKGDWVFPDAGAALRQFDSRGGNWTVGMDHVHDPRDDRHDAAGDVDHAGLDVTLGVLGHYFAEVMFPGDSRTLKVGELMIEVTFVHEAGDHSLLSNILRR